MSYYGFWGRQRINGGGGEPVVFNAVTAADFSDETGAEPVTLAEAKNWCKIELDYTAEDTKITTLIKAAREQCEKYVNLSFIRRTVTATIQGHSAGSRLPYGPVLDEADIVYVTDSDGADYANYSFIGGLYTPRYSGSYTVQYEAGYTILPGMLKLAVLNQIGYLYQHNGDESTGMLSPNVVAILKPLRIID